MSPEELLGTSAAEQRLYGELRDVYAELGRVIEVASAEELGRLGTRASAITEELRRVAARLGPVRLGRGRVAPQVIELWRATAGVAAEAAALNGELRARASARAESIAARLAVVVQGRRGLRAYRPAGTGAPRFTHGVA